MSLRCHLCPTPRRFSGLRVGGSACVHAPGGVFSSPAALVPIIVSSRGPPAFAGNVVTAVTFVLSTLFFYDLKML